MLEEGTLKPGWRRALRVALVLVPAAWWGCRLWAGIPTRAFDPSDPSEQLDQARVPFAQFQARGPLGWINSVVSDPGAKPLQTALMSSAFLLGIPANHVGYEIVTGLFTIALFAAIQILIARWRGDAAGLIFAGLALSSNVLLQQALYGGHSWIGQAFLWLAAGLWLLEGPPLVPKRAFFFGLLLGAAMLSSYHMAPLIAALVLAWAAAFGCDAARRKTLKLAPLGAALLGLGGVLAFLEVTAFAVPRHHYWETLSWQFTAARNVPKTYRDAGFYLYDLLRACESGAWLGALGLLSAAGALLLGREAKSEPASWPWLVLPAAALAFAQAPTTIKLERTCLPAVIALLPLAAIGAETVLRRAVPQRWRTGTAGILCAILICANAPARARTWRAFHAGAAIESAIESRGGRPPAVVVGISLPYIYEPGREIRVASMDALRQAVAQGHDWILVSYMSPWWWNAFLPESRLDIPVHKVYASSAPYIAVPGVESSTFQLFSNETQYHLIKTGQMPFPLENRLYRASDFLAAAAAPAEAARSGARGLTGRGIFP